MVILHECSDNTVSCVPLHAFDLLLTNTCNFRDLSTRKPSGHEKHNARRELLLQRVY